MKLRFFIKRIGITDTLGRTDFEFRILDERAEPKGAAITLRGDGSCRGWPRSQGGPDAPQGFACTGKLNNVLYMRP